LTRSLCSLLNKRPGEGRVHCTYRFALIDTTIGPTDHREVQLISGTRLAAMAVAVVLAVVAAPPSPIAQADVTPQAPTGMGITDVAVPSASLGQVPVLIAVPARTAPAGGWPVLYLLVGSSSNRFVWQSHFPDIFAKASSDGVMLVMPEAGVAGYYSNWKTGPAWETFHTSELPAYLRAQFNADLSRQAIAGYSMGGFGALSYAARHPGRYRAVVALSPVADPLRNPSIVFDDLRVAKASKYKLWGNPKTKSGKSTWKHHDPYYLAKGLRGTYLYVYAGKNGGSLENTLRAQTIKLVKRLTALGTKKLHITLSSHTGTKGTHSYHYWPAKLYAAWPSVAAALYR
jgi:S-formylglutathione hydrolase FrmB